MSKTEGGLKHMLTALQDYTAKNGMTINTKKLKQSFSTKLEDTFDEHFTLETIN